MINEFSYFLKMKTTDATQFKLSISNNEAKGFYLDVGICFNYLIGLK